MTLQIGTFRAVVASYDITFRHPMNPWCLGTSPAQSRRFMDTSKIF